MDPDQRFRSPHCLCNQQQHRFGQIRAIQIQMQQFFVLCDHMVDEGHVIFIHLTQRHCEVPVFTPLGNFRKRVVFHQTVVREVDASDLAVFTARLEQLGKAPCPDLVVTDVQLL
jgi:hypothetical protein